MRETCARELRIGRETVETTKPKSVMRIDLGLEELDYDVQELASIREE